MEELSNLESTRDVKQSLESTQGLSENLADSHSDLCAKCRSTIEDECDKFEDKRWHLHCLICSACKRELRNSLSDALWTPQERGRVVCRNCAPRFPDAKEGFQHTTRLKQYIFLLRVALARLLVMLRQGGTLPHTSGILAHRFTGPLLSTDHQPVPQMTRICRNMIRPKVTR